jgi:hypothetical protein
MVQPALTVGDKIENRPVCVPAVRFAPAVNDGAGMVSVPLNTPALTFPDPVMVDDGIENVADRTDGDVTAAPVTTGA